MTGEHLGRVARTARVGGRRAGRTRGARSGSRPKRLPVDPEVHAVLQAIGTELLGDAGRGRPRRRHRRSGWPRPSSPRARSCCATRAAPAAGTRSTSALLQGIGRMSMSVAAAIQAAARGDPGAGRAADRPGTDPRRRAPASAGWRSRSPGPTPRRRVVGIDIFPPGPRPGSGERRPAPRWTTGSSSGSRTRWPWRRRRSSRSSGCRCRSSRRPSCPDVLAAVRGALRPGRLADGRHVRRRRRGPAGRADDGPAYRALRRSALGRRRSAARCWPRPGYVDAQPRCRGPGRLRSTSSSAAAALRLETPLEPVTDDTTRASSLRLTG